MAEQTKYILVVDDDRETRAFLEAVLTSRGYKALSAAHGLEAVKLVQTQTPDLVITDVMMPVMDGEELCAFLRTHQQTSKIPLVVMTAMQNVPRRKTWDEYVEKPLDVDRFLRRIDELLLGKRSSGGGSGGGLLNAPA